LLLLKKTLLNSYVIFDGILKLRGFGFQGSDRMGHRYDFKDDKELRKCGNEDKLIITNY
jgi:hypothetical protein